MTTRTKRLSLLSSSLLLVSLAIFISALFVTQSRGEALILEYDLLRERDAIEQKLQDVQNITEMSADERALLKEYFITERDIITFINSLEQQADAAQLEFETTQLAVDPKTDEDPGILKIGFTFSGTKPRVVGFMQLLESLPYHKTIPSAAVTQSETAPAGNWEGQVILHVTLQP